MALTPNVVAGAPILSAWGNEIRDRTVQRFASAAARTSGWVAPPVGASSVLDDTPGVVWVYTGTTWLAQDWNAAWGIIAITGAITQVNSANAVTVDVAGAALTWTALANRRYRYTFEGHVFVNPSPAQAMLFITDAANVVKGAPGRFDTMLFGSTVATNALCISQEVPGAGAQTRKVRIQSIAGGNATLLIDAPSARTALFMVEDMGPSGAAP